VQGNESNYTFYATPNVAATPFVDPELLADPAVFPPEDLVARLEAAEDTSANPQRVEIWAEFRSKVGQG
jgi:spermidine/putrescine-binding protein